MGELGLEGLASRLCHQPPQPQLLPPHSRPLNPNTLFHTHPIHPPNLPHTSSPPSLLTFSKPYVPLSSPPTHFPALTPYTLPPLPASSYPRISPYLPHTSPLTFPTHFSTPSTLTPYTLPHFFNPLLPVTSPTPLPSPTPHPKTLSHTHPIHSLIPPPTLLYNPHLPLSSTHTPYLSPHLSPHPNTLSHILPRFRPHFFTSPIFSYLPPHLPYLSTLLSSPHPMPQHTFPRSPHTLFHIFPHIVRHVSTSIPHHPHLSLRPNTLFHTPPPLHLPPHFPSPSLHTSPHLKHFSPLLPPHFPFQIFYCLHLQYGCT